MATRLFLPLWYDCLWTLWATWWIIMSHLFVTNIHRSSISNVYKNGVILELGVTNTHVAQRWYQFRIVGKHAIMRIVLLGIQEAPMTFGPMRLCGHQALRSYSNIVSPVFLYLMSMWPFYVIWKWVHSHLIVLGTCMLWASGWAKIMEIGSVLFSL